MFLDNIETEQLSLMAIAGLANYVVIFAWNYSQPENEYTVHEWKLHLAKVFWYATAGMYEFRLLAGNPWFPEILGGKGETMNWLSPHHVEAAPAFATLYACHWLYHTFSFVTSVLPGNRTKPEMIFHHVITCTLVTVSWYWGRTQPGTIVLLLHDIPDVPTSLLKTFYSLKKKIPTLICFGLMVVSWIFFRIYLLSTFAYAVVSHPNGIHDLDQDNLTMTILGCFLWALVSLHTFWFYMFMQMAQKFAGNTKTLPDDITEKGKSYNTGVEKSETSSSAMGEIKMRSGRKIQRNAS